MGFQAGSRSGDDEKAKATQSFGGQPQTAGLYKPKRLISTPADELDDEPAISAADQITDGTGSINDDGGDQRVDDRALVVTDELHRTPSCRSRNTAAKAAQPKIRRDILSSGYASPYNCIDDCLQRLPDERTEEVEGKDQPPTPAIVNDLDAIPSI
ncbi:hypothetical protein BDZ45DRAFT_697178 [Acephala macrosclerotiorum]|nr:hypothetical protein BDZ45DRAFT_697178 [Acephala macrosclerotiorum]